MMTLWTTMFTTRGRSEEGEEFQENELIDPYPLEGKYKDEVWS